MSVQEAASESTSCDRLRELALASTDLARLVSKNPSAPPELLQELSASSDQSTRENVATNPNTPTEVLLNLGAEFPKQLLDNPVFSLLLLENLNLVDEMPLNTLRSILKQEQVPVYFLEQAADKQDLEVQLAIVMNAKTPREGLAKAKLLHSQYPQVVEAVQLHVNAYPHLRCELYYADAEAYGPYTLNPDSSLPSPTGGGGTSFVPFFSKVQENWDGYTQGVCIYLTDGYGSFPEQPPSLQ